MIDLNNINSNRVICPYCGYKLPVYFSSNSSCSEISLICKGRNCKKKFNLIIRDGVQKNVVPDSETIEAFEQVYGSDYKSQIFQSFGVVL